MPKLRSGFSWWLIVGRLYSFTLRNTKPSLSLQLIENILKLDVLQIHINYWSIDVAQRINGSVSHCFLEAKSGKFCRDRAY